MNKGNFIIQGYDLNKIELIKNRKNYKIFCYKDGKRSRIRLLTCSASIPFGIEKFYNKYVVNLSLYNPKTNNDSHNFYSLLESIDEYFIKFKDSNKLPTDLKILIQDKYYTSCIKTSAKYPPILRTHMRTSKNKIISKFVSYDDPNKVINENSIKKKSGKFTVEIDSLWINNDSYGLIYHLNGGRIYE